MDDVDASLLIGAGVESPAENVSRLVARTILQVFIDAQVHAPYDAKLRLVIPSSWRLTASSRSYLTSRNPTSARGLLYRSAVASVKRHEVECKDCSIVLLEMGEEAWLDTWSVFATSSSWVASAMA